MVGFPMLMYYMWIGATYYDGHFPRPAEGQTWSEFAEQLGGLIYGGAFPHLKAWTIYWTFFILRQPATFTSQVCTPKANPKT